MPRERTSQGLLVGSFLGQWQLLVQDTGKGPAREGQTLDRTHREQCLTSLLLTFERRVDHTSHHWKDRR